MDNENKVQAKDVEIDLEKNGKDVAGGNGVVVNGTAVVYAARDFVIDYAAEGAKIDISAPAVSKESDAITRVTPPVGTMFGVVKDSITMAGPATDALHIGMKPLRKPEMN